MKTKVMNIEGQNYVLYMFDFEDIDATNDVIDKVKEANND